MPADDLAEGVGVAGDVGREQARRRRASSPGHSPVDLDVGDRRRGRQPVATCGNDVSQISR